MSKAKKKRTAKAKTTSSQKPNVHKYKAVVRSPLAEWWLGRKKAIKIVVIATLVIAFIVYLIIEFFRLLF